MNNIIWNRLFNKVEKPVRYGGGEFNMVKKDLDKVEIRYLFAFPDVYEVGMSHLGLKIIYHLINKRTDTWCERAFSPWVDMEEQLINRNIPLFSIESRSPISDFDIIGATLQYEMSYTNLLNMLKLGNIPLLREERSDEHPLIMVGGPCAYNPEPLADFIDLAVIGDGEEIINQFLDLFKEWKQNNGSRDEFLYSAAQIQGIYVPSFYDVTYNDDDTVKSIKPNREGVPDVVTKTIVTDFENAFFPEDMIVPYMNIIHDRVVMEIFRGCTRGCRFCQAGMLYRPIRERSIEKIMSLTEKTLKSTGYDELSLSSLSTGDYSDIHGLVETMMNKYLKDRISLSLPSLRIDSFSGKYAEQVQKVRKTGLTFAPEAGSQRLRDVINKGVNENDMIKSSTEAFEAGWDRVKLYFMLGLPTETDEDILGIAALVRKVRSAFYSIPKDKRKRGFRGVVSTSYFVPKAHTPYQWFGQDTIEEFSRKQALLGSNMRIKGVDYNWHEAKLSHLEAVFARGDRRLGKVLKRAVMEGCRMDGWDEHFDYNKWMKCFEDEGVDTSFYANRHMNKDDILPWSHISCGVSEDYLWQEYQKSLDGEITPDCREGCINCGVNTTWKGIC